MADAIEQADQELTTALATFERGKASLYRSDGSMKYSEPEHNERLRALTETLHGVAEGIDRAVDGEIATVRQLLDSEHDDPTLYLSASELTLANARSQFIREDAMTLPLPQLLTRLRGIIAAGGGKPDRVQAFVWSRYAYQRLTSEVETARAEGKPLPATLRDQIEAIEPLVTQLRGVVSPGLRITGPEADRRMKRARDARQAAHGRVTEADGTRERMMAEMARRYGVF